MLEKIAEILKDYKGDQELVITEQTTFVELELDSLDTVELVMSIEEEFSVTIEMSEDIKSVGDLMKIISAA
jgi:acyl carrier protein